MLTSKKRPWPVAHIKIRDVNTITDEEYELISKHIEENTVEGEASRERLLSLIKSGKLHPAYIDANGEPHLGPKPIKEK